MPTSNLWGAKVKNIALACVLFAVLPLSATTIPVPNYSFEENSPGYGNPTGWSLFTSSTSPTFSANVQTVLNNGGTFPVVSGVSGLQFAAVHLDHNATSPGHPIPVIPPNGSLDGLVSDNLGTFAPNTIYTLTAAFGLSSAYNTFDVGLALGSGAPTLADVFPAPPHPRFAFFLINGSLLTDDTLQDGSLTLNTSLFPSLVGEPINISLIFHSEYPYGRDAIFDNVSLSSQAVPEPSSLILITMGGFTALLGRAKFQRKRI
jgi:hypothetical protein